MVNHVVLFFFLFVFPLKYHDAQLKLCGGGRWELTDLRGGSNSSLSEEL